MLSSRNLLRQALFELTTEDLRVTVSVSGSWRGFKGREEESVLDKVEGGEEGEEESSQEEAMDVVWVRLEVGLPEHSEGLKLFGRTTGKL